MELDSHTLERLALDFLSEDVGRGDITTRAAVEPSANGRARIEARADFVVAGLPVAAAVFAALPRTEWSQQIEDGTRVEAGDELAIVDGSLASILTAERTALNLLARLSGIATLTARYVEAVAGTSVRILDTRKTTPGLRLLEKYAVRVGGGHNHRFGLDDGVLIKDNHIAAAGGIWEATQRARAVAPHNLRIEVEVQDLAGLDDALSAGADAVLLDNMTVAEARAAVQRAGGKVLLEASGGITLDNVRAYAETGVDFVSVGALTHSATSVDVSLEVIQ